MCGITKMTTKFEIKKFNKSNFSLWKMKMRAIFIFHNCLKAIILRPEKITGDKWNEWTAMQLLIYTWHSDGVLYTVAEEKTVKSIWDTFTKLYETKSLHNKIFLKRRLYTLRMGETTTATDHISTLKTLFSQLTMFGIK